LPEGDETDNVYLGESSKKTVTHLDLGQQSVVVQEPKTRYIIK